MKKIILLFLVSYCFRVSVSATQVFVPLEIETLRQENERVTDGFSKVFLGRKKDIPKEQLPSGGYGGTFYPLWYKYNNRVFFNEKKDWVPDMKSFRVLGGKCAIDKNYIYYSPDGSWYRWESNIVNIDQVNTCSCFSFFDENSFYVVLPTSIDKTNGTWVPPYILQKKEGMNPYGLICYRMSHNPLMINSNGIYTDEGINISLYQNHRQLLSEKIKKRIEEYHLDKKRVIDNTKRLYFSLLDYNMYHEEEYDYYMSGTIPYGKKNNPLPFAKKEDRSIVLKAVIYDLEHRDETK